MTFFVAESVDIASYHFLSGFSFTDTGSSRSLTFRHLFTTFHVRWLSRIFDRTTCIYQTLFDETYHLTQLPFDWLLIDDAMLFLFVSTFLLRQLDLENWWAWARITTNEEINISVGGAKIHTIKCEKLLGVAVPSSGSSIIEL